MRIEPQIRKMIFNNQPIVKHLMLTERQINIVCLARDRGSITSHVVAWFFKISAQNSSVQLRRLHEKGYLIRKKVTAETGGIEYIYESAMHKGI